MLNLTKILGILKINVVCLLLITSLVHAEERQLVNSITVSLREGPGAQYKIIKTLPGDQSFEVLETLNDFIRIRTKDGTEGWLQERSTQTRPLEVTTAKDLSEKVDALGTKQGEKLTSSSGRLTAQHSDASIDSQPRKEVTEQPSVRESAEVKKLQFELGEMTKRFEQLEATSADEQQLKIENDRLKTELATMQATMSQLQQANTSLAKNQNIYWFLAGSAVLFLGWLIGRTTIRRQRHSSLTL